MILREPLLDRVTSIEFKSVKYNQKEKYLQKTRTGIFGKYLLLRNIIHGNIKVKRCMERKKYRGCEICLACLVATQTNDLEELLRKLRIAMIIFNLQYEWNKKNKNSGQFASILIH